MDKVFLGDTSLKVSRIGLGTVKFGRNEGVKYPVNFEIPSEDHLHDLLKLAQSLGINTLDTAPSYGSSEERLGRLLENNRKEWIIIGKAGEEFINGHSTFDFSADAIEASLERSLERLKTDYLDALLLHSDGNDLKILGDNALIQKLYDLKKQGLIKAIGASTKTPEGGIKSLELLDLAMITYTKDYQEEKPVLDYALKHNKGIILKKILSSGHSSNTNDAIQHAFSHKGTGCAIIGTINPKHLTENIQSYNNLPF